MGKHETRLLYAQSCMWQYQAAQPASRDPPSAAAAALRSSTPQLSLTTTAQRVYYRTDVARFTRKMRRPEMMRQPGDN
jgi:hypothetical protein